MKAATKYLNAAELLKIKKSKRAVGERGESGGLTAEAEERARR